MHYCNITQEFIVQNSCLTEYVLKSFIFCFLSDFLFCFLILFYFIWTENGHSLKSNHDHYRWTQCINFPTSNTSIEYYKIFTFGRRGEKSKKKKNWLNYWELKYDGLCWFKTKKRQINLGPSYRSELNSVWIYDYFSSHLKLKSNIHDIWLLIYHLVIKH